MTAGDKRPCAAQPTPVCSRVQRICPSAGHPADFPPPSLRQTIPYRNLRQRQWMVVPPVADIPDAPTEAPTTGASS